MTATKQKGGDGYLFCLLNEREGQDIPNTCTYHFTNQIKYYKRTSSSYKSNIQKLSILCKDFLRPDTVEP